MKRALLIVTTSVLASGLIGTAADAATQVRHFQADLIPVGPPPGQAGGQLGLDVVFKNKPSTPRKFTPRQLIVVDIANMPVTCRNPSGQGNMATTLTRRIQTQAKLTNPPPPNGKPKPTRYSYKFATGFPDFTGVLSGKVFKRQGRGKVIANGSLTVTDLDFEGGPTDCATEGPRGWSAP